MCDNTSFVSVTCTCGETFSVDLGITPAQDKELWELAAKMAQVCVCDKCAKDAECRKAQAERHKKRLRAIEEAGIPQNFINWKAELSPLPELYHWVFANRDNSLFISGNYGIGKTWAMCANAAILAETRRVGYWNCQDLIAEYTGISQEKSTRVADAFIKKQAMHDLIVLDDLGKKFYENAPGECLYKLVNGIYERRGTIWVSANVSGPNLINMFRIKDTGHAILDRLDSKRLAALDWATADVNNRRNA